MVRKHFFNARQLMEKAVQVMRESVPEPRNDGKASPRVGAVIVKPDGTIETASRGELRHPTLHYVFARMDRDRKHDNVSRFHARFGSASVSIS